MSDSKYLFEMEHTVGFTEGEEYNLTRFIFTQLQTVMKFELIQISQRGKWDPLKHMKQNNKAKGMPRIEMKKRWAIKWSGSTSSLDSAAS